MALLRDLMILGATGGSSAGLSNPDLVERLLRLEPLAGGRLPGLVGQLDSAITGIARMGNRQLLIEDFLLGVVTPDRTHAPTRPS